MTNEEAVRKVKETRAEPFIELSPQALKVRRNLLLCCVFCTAIFFGADIDGGPSGGGLRVTGLPLDYLPFVVTIITVYFLIYFIWLGWQTYRKWKLRRAAETQIEKMLSGGSAYGFESDYSSSQETVMIWLQGAYDGIVKATNQALQELHHFGPPKENQRIEVKEVAKKTEALTMAMQRFETHGEYASNFVKSFKRYQKALRITWWLEYFLPIGLGTTSIALILWHVIHGHIAWPWLNP